MGWIEQIKQYKPQNEQETNDKEIFLECINKFPHILTRESKLAHITSSAFVVNKTKDKVLMVYHNIYDSWSWTGGHADGNEDLLSVAMSEVQEETGIKNIIPIDENIFSLDILPVLGHIKRGNYISPHLHLSVAYLVSADENELLIVKEDENSDVMWIPMDEVNNYSSEPHMQKVYDKFIKRIKGL